MLSRQRKKTKATAEVEEFSPMEIFVSENGNTSAKGRFYINTSDDVNSFTYTQVVENTSVSMCAQYSEHAFLRNTFDSVYLSNWLGRLSRCLFCKYM